MTFLHPWALYAGVVAAGLPVLIHFLTRPRPAPQPLSTLRFVRELLRQRSARNRLRDFLVLLCRTAMILCVAAAIARPQWGESAATGPLEAGDTVRVVVLDVSQSMAANERGLALFERARTKASQQLRYQSGLHANLLLSAASTHGVFEQPSTNFEALQDGLRGARVTSQRLDARRALEAAARMLNNVATGAKPRRELVIVSDFQTNNWTSAGFSAIPADVRIRLISAAPAEPLSNLAIVRAECPDRAVVGRAAPLEVEVANVGPARSVNLDVTLGDVTRRLHGQCEANHNLTLREEIVPPQSGWQWGHARLIDNDDALKADDARPLVVEVRPRPFYALITRQSPSGHSSSSYFLDRALAPYADNKELATATLRRLPPQNLDREALAGADLIALDHPGKLDDLTIKLLSSLMRRGKSLLYVTAEPVDAVNLKLLGENVGRAWQLPVEFVAMPANQERRDAFLASYRREAPALRAFGEQLDAALGGLRFAGGLSAHKVDAGVADDVLASYNDGAPAVLLTAVDAGGLLILNADLAASNVSSSEVFLPLLEELVQQLLGRRHSRTSSPSGELLSIQLPSDIGAAAGLSVVGPDGAAPPAPSAYGTLSDDGAGIEWRWSAAGAPGVYRVVRDGRTVFALGVTIPEDESVLNYLPQEMLTQRLSAGRSVHYQSAAEEEPDSDRLWVWLCVVCVACALCEVGLHLGFRS